MGGIRGCFLLAIGVVRRVMNANHDRPQDKSRQNGKHENSYEKVNLFWHEPHPNAFFHEL
jgi:hypothetical protein